MSIVKKTFKRRFLQPLSTALERVVQR